jgi:hypothetical protein
MGQRAAVMVILATTTGLTLLALAGHNPWTGRRVLEITENHGLHAGDVLPLGAWAVVAVCCVLLWRRTD